MNQVVCDLFSCFFRYSDVILWRWQCNHCNLCKYCHHCNDLKDGVVLSLLVRICDVAWGIKDFKKILYSCCLHLHEQIFTVFSQSQWLWIVWSSSFYGFSNLVHCNQTQRPTCAEKDGIRVITPDKPRSSWKSLTSRTFDFLNERNLSCELQLIFGKV